MKNPFVRLLVLAGALSIALGAATQTEPHAANSSAKVRLAQLDAIADYRTETWRWQALMSKQKTPTYFSERRSQDLAYLRWMRDLWRTRAGKAERLAQNPPHRRQWLCIHRYERHPGQGWATRTGNGYYGGLQMDISFQRTYGGELLRRKGTANRWTRRRADVGRRARLPERPRLLPLAEHGPQLRPDLGLVVLVVGGAAAAPLPEVDGEEDAGDRDREQRLDDRAADAAVSDDRR